MYSNEHTLQDLLRKAYHRLDMDDIAMEMEVKRAYTLVAGDFISRLTRTAKFSKGTLTLVIMSPALKHELSYRRSSLAEKINETIGRAAVKQIVLI